jgi:hypothetical protein
MYIHFMSVDLSDYWPLQFLIEFVSKNCDFTSFYQKLKIITAMYIHFMSVD